MGVLSLLCLMGSSVESYSNDVLDTKKETAKMNTKKIVWDAKSDLPKELDLKKVKSFVFTVFWSEYEVTIDHDKKTWSHILDGETLETEEFKTYEYIEDHLKQLQAQNAEGNTLESTSEIIFHVAE